MAQQRIRVAAVVMALALGACLAANGVAAQTVSNTLQDPKNAGTCLARFTSVIDTYYANDTTCADLITEAMNTTVPANCPGGQAVAGGQVQQCMYKNGTQAIVDAWSGFIRNCEVMYIANRGGQGESEEGFTYNENSCFPRYNSFSEFTSWLTTAATPGSTPASSPADTGGAAGSIRVALSAVAGMAVLALLALCA